MLRTWLNTGWTSLTGITSLPGAPQAVALGAAIGLFVAFTPTPGLQMVLAAALAAVFRASKAAAMAAVWVTNPLTTAPVCAASYGLGVVISPGSGPIMALTIGGLWLGAVAACIGYLLVRGAIARLHPVTATSPSPVPALPAAR